jgi:hypothetical protein
MIQFPPNIQALVTDIVGSYHGGNKAPPEIETLKTWVMGDGWSAIAESWGDMMALDIKKIAKERFHDQEVLDNWMQADASTDVVTDEDKVAWARQLIEDVFSSGESELAPSIHTVELSHPSGKNAQLCFLLRIEGHDPVFDWFGIYKSNEDFYESLALEHNYVVSHGESEIDPQMILKLWGMPKDEDTL